MGCDIHLTVERKQSDGTWKVEPPTEKLREDTRAYYNELYNGKPPEYAQFEIDTRWYHDRNYDCFAILANVRNGHGFAGIKTGDGFNFISEPKGLPRDLSTELRTPINKYALEECGFDVSDIPERPDDSEDDDRDIWLGDHSWSWLTLRELQAFDWTQRTGKRGVISWAQFVKREHEKDTGPPHEYSGSVSGHNIVTINEQDARLLLACGGVDDAGKVNLSKCPEPYRSTLNSSTRVEVDVQWGTLYSDAAGRFYSLVMPALSSLDSDPDNVRIVFGFDS